jgi:hypothetical protein
MPFDAFAFAHSQGRPNWPQYVLQNVYQIEQMTT